MGQDSTVSHSIIINRPRHEVYEFWRDWSNWPRFSSYLKSVEEITPGHTRWIAKGPVGDISWDASTSEDVPGEIIAWHSIGENTVDNSGKVLFNDSPDGLGTLVSVTMDYDIPGGIVGELVAKVTHTSPQTEIEESMQQFKAHLENAEVAMPPRVEVL
ncbi:hypothetical protein BH11ARM1_BH11ARM1_04120 [soil metagenome]